MKTKKPQVLHYFRIVLICAFSSSNIFGMHKESPDQDEFEIAVKSQNVGRMEELLKRGNVLVNKPVEIKVFTLSPLVHAIVTFDVHFDMIQTLLQYHANVNVVDPISGLSPLHYLFCFGQKTRAEMIRCTKLLLAHGAQKSIKDCDGWMPFVIASRSHLEECIELCMVDDMQQKQKALTQAIHCAQPRSIATLLLHNTQVNQGHLSIFEEVKTRWLRFDTFSFENNKDCLDDIEDLLVNKEESVYFRNYCKDKFNRYHKSKSIYNALKSREVGK